MLNQKKKKRAMNNPKLIIDTIVQDLSSKRILVYSEITKVLMPSNNDDKPKIGATIDGVDALIEDVAMIDLKLSIAYAIKNQIDQFNETKNNNSEEEDKEKES